MAEKRELVQITTDIFKDQAQAMEKITDVTTLGRAYQIRHALDKLLKLPKKTKRK